MQLNAKLRKVLNQGNFELYFQYNENATYSKVKQFISQPAGKLIHIMICGKINLYNDQQCLSLKYFHLQDNENQQNPEFNIPGNL